jgi:hypothetical protein
MSGPYPPPQTRIIFTPPPGLKVYGCSGCSLGCLVFLLLVFLAGGVFGMLLFGWRTLFAG